MCDVAAAEGSGLDRDAVYRVLGGVIAEAYCADITRERRVCRRVYRRTHFPADVADRLASALAKVFDQYVYGPSEVQCVSTKNHLIMSYCAARGREMRPSDVEAAGYLGRALGELHQMGGFPGMGSIYSHVLNEATCAVQFGDPPEVQAASRRLCSLDAAIFEQLLDNRGRATHGDLTAENVVTDGRSGITIIDWDKFGSISPELDYAMTAFSLPLKSPDYLIRHFDEVYRDTTGRYDSNLLATALSTVGDMALVHDWHRAESTGLESRRLNLVQWAMPHWFTWTDRRALLEG